MIVAVMVRLFSDRLEWFLSIITVLFTLRGVIVKFELVYAGCVSIEIVIKKQVRASPKNKLRLKVFKEVIESWS